MEKNKDINLEIELVGEEKERMKRFVEKYLKCKRCGSRNSTYSAVREEMICRKCGNTWSVREEEMQGEM